jgi:uracil phosphoribosyltransferase
MATQRTLPPNCRVIQHPLIDHKMAQLRDITTQPERFRRVMRDLSRLMAYEMTRELKTKSTQIKTPLETVSLPTLDETVCIVSVMRAGNGMLDGFLDMIPLACVGHIGIYRDKFIDNTVEYYFKVPTQSKGMRVLMVDPMLATGGTSISAIDRLKEYGVGPIHMACLLSSPEGLQAMHEAHPDVLVTTLSVDRQLNEKGYILPGLGDAGDRLYGTPHD